MIDEKIKISELMGYTKHYEELTFVTGRNAGQMVAKIQPKWALRILKDFIF